MTRADSRGVTLSRIRGRRQRSTLGRSERAILCEARFVPGPIARNLDGAFERPLRLVRSTELVQEDAPPHVGRREALPPRHDAIVDLQRLAVAARIDQESREPEVERSMVGMT
jgi:hypothetical protein